MKTSSSRLRHGLTIVEVLVAVFVLGLIIAISFPAVQSAREAARSSGCRQKLKNLATAVLNYESLHGIYPPSKAASSSSGYGGSFIVGVLPFLEEHALYLDFVTSDLLVPSVEQRIGSANVPILYCPSNAGPRQSNYLGNSGTGLLAWGLNGMFRPLAASVESGLYRSGPLRVSDVVDGTSNTTLLSEKGSGNRTARNIALWLTPEYYEAGRFEVFLNTCDSIPDRPELYGWRGEKFRPLWYFAAIGDSLYNHALPPNHPSCKNGMAFVSGGAITASGYHHGGINVAFADGHLRFVSDSIDHENWRKLGSRVDRDFVFEASK